MKTQLVALQIELTNACRLACAECARPMMSRRVGHMKLDLARLLVNEAIAYDRSIGFNVNGLGEPLLYPHFAPLVEHLSNSGAHHVDLFTSLIAPQKLVDAAFSALAQTHVPVKLAITKHLYDKNGKRQFEDAEFDRNLEFALARVKGNDRHIAVVLTKHHTQKDVEQFRNRYAAMFHPENFHIIERLNPWFNLVRDMAHPAFGPQAEPGRHICDYPFILLHVGWNGDVIICCSDDVDGECVLGHIEKEGDLRAVWEGPVLEAVREKHRNYIIDMKPCDKCERTAWARQAA